MLRTHKTAKLSGSGRRSARFVLYVCLCVPEDQRWLSGITIVWPPGSLEHFVSPSPSTPRPSMVICSCPSRRDGAGGLVSEILVGNTSLPCRQFIQQTAVFFSWASAFISTSDLHFILLGKKKFSQETLGLCWSLPIITGGQAPAVGFHTCPVLLL